MVNEANSAHSTVQFPFPHEGQNRMDMASLTYNWHHTRQKRSPRAKGNLKGRNLEMSTDNFLSAEATAEREQEEEKRLFLAEEARRKNRDKEFLKTKMEQSQAATSASNILACTRASSPSRAPPREYIKSVLGWHDPLVDTDHMLGHIDGFERRWREEEELTSDTVDRIFDGVDKLNTSSVSLAADVSDDSVELSFYRKRCMVDNSTTMDLSLLSECVGQENMSDLPSITPTSITGFFPQYPHRIHSENRESEAAIIIQCQWRVVMAHRKVLDMRACLVASGRTAVTILQKWYHIGKCPHVHVSIAIQKALTIDLMY